MDGVKCHFCYEDGEIILHLGNYSSDACIYSLRELLKDLPKIPYKIQGKNITGLIIDDLANGEGNGTV
jgi:hypothetical protein